MYSGTISLLKKNTIMEKQVINYPSTRNITCPKCHNKDFRILGVKGAMSSSIFTQLFFGWIGNLVKSANSKSDTTLKPTQCKCNICGKKFEVYPVNAESDEILEKPCRITFTRLSCFAGSAVTQHIYLNGIKVASIGNGKTVTFETTVRHNTIFVTDHYGIAFKWDCKFEAESGGNKEISFKRKWFN